MITTCMTSLEFCYGHRLKDHQGKCATLHGHSATVKIYAAPHPRKEPQLTDGMVVDFSILKNEIGGWIDHNWDHTMILDRSDELTVSLLKQCPAKKPLFLMDTPPTAEALANYLLLEVCPKVLSGKGVIVYKIELFENPRSMAEASFTLSEKSLIDKLYPLNQVTNNSDQQGLQGELL